MIIENLKQQNKNLEKEISQLNRIKLLYIIAIILLILSFGIGSFLLIKKNNLIKQENKQLIIKINELKDNNNKNNNKKTIKKENKTIIKIKKGNKEQKITKEQLQKILNKLYHEKKINYNIIIH